MSFRVASTTRVDFLLSGGGSNTNDADIIVKDMNGNVVKTVYVDPMFGKSQTNRQDSTNSKSAFSKWAVVDGLDASQIYVITVAPSAKNAQLQVDEMNELEEVTKVYKPATEVLGAAVNFANDIELSADLTVSNIKAGAVYVAAMHIYGTDLSVSGSKHFGGYSYMADAYSPVGKTTEGYPFQFINMSNTLQNDAPTTQFDAQGTGTVVNKYAINDTYSPWISYYYTASILNPWFNAKTYESEFTGKNEVSRGGYYSSINPITGANEVTYMTDDAGLWLGSPKVEVGYVKGDTYLASLNPKKVIFTFKDTKKIKILLTGAGGNVNYADVKLLDEDYQTVKTITTDLMNGKSNKADGSASNSLWATFDKLDPNKAYCVEVAPSMKEAQIQVEEMNELEEVTKVYKPASEVISATDFFDDIDLTADQKVTNVKCASVAVLGVRLYTADTDDLKELVEEAAATTEPEAILDLDNNTTYYLNDVAKVGTTPLQINGHAAKIIVNNAGQITAKSSLAIDNVIIDATAATVAPIAMASSAEMTAADTTALYSYSHHVEDATYYTADEAAAYIVENAAAIAAGEKDPIHEGDLKAAAIDEWVANYEGANQKVFEAQILSLTNSKVKTAWSLISANDVPWALRKLYLENNIIEFAYNDKKDKKENISWYGGGNSIQDITFVNNTFFCDSVSNNAYFLRYSNGSNAQPQKVWGTDATASWTMLSNTFVNIASNGQFANNYSNKNNVTNDFEKNIFANTRYLQKIGSSIVRNFEPTDNVICGGTNAVDGTDKTRYATEESADRLGVYYNSVEDANFVPGVMSAALRDKMGDPRWLADAPEYVDPVDSLKKLYAKGWDLFDTMKLPGSTEYVNLVTELTTANGILNPESGDVDAQAAYNELAPLAAAIDAYNNLINPATGIANVAAEKAANDGRVYNIAGQRVNANTKGMVIKNGKKYIVK